MTISKIIDGLTYMFILEGRLDTTSAPELQDMLMEMKDKDESISLLVFDMEKVEYVSSAGLRALLWGQKMMDKKGKMKLIHVNDFVKEILYDVGFLDFMTVE